MTLVSDIIKRAYRECNLIPLVSDPSANQSTEALPLLNSIIMSTIGNEAGDEFTNLNYGGDYDQSDCISEWVPDNTRLILNLEAATTLYLDPMPYEGQRIAVADVSGNLNTFNLILDGNGRTIEDAATATLDTDGLNREWMYRADTGNWTRVAPLTTSDEMPFPIEFDDYFIILLAIRLNPRYGQELSSQSFETMKRSRGQLRSRYRGKNYYITADPAIVMLPSNRYANSYYSSDFFDRGYFRLW